MKIKKIKRKAGFTLVEILIVLSLAVFILSGIYLFYFSSIRTSSRETVNLDLQKNGRIALEYIIRDLRAVCEFLEIKKDRIVMVKFPKTSGYYSSGETEKITYVLRKNPEGADLLKRIKGGEERTILRIKEIGQDIFSAYYEDIKNPGQLVEFNYDENPSDQREHTSLIRVNLELKENNQSLSLQSHVCVRYIHTRNRQPFWKRVTL